MSLSSIAQAFRNAAKRVASPVFTKVLVSVANDIANDARDNASWSSKIPSAIRVGTANYEGATTSIDIIVDKIEAPMAVAYEYGSGIWGEDGEEYVIEARNAPALAFLWLPGGRKIEPYAENVVFQQVDHPGVEARPFLQPAVDSNMESFKAKAAGLLVEILVEELGVTVSYDS